MDAVEVMGIVGGIGDWDVYDADWKAKFIKLLRGAYEKMECRKFVFSLHDMGPELMGIFHELQDRGYLLVAESVVVGYQNMFITAPKDVRKLIDKCTWFIDINQDDGLEDYPEGCYKVVTAMSQGILVVGLPYHQFAYKAYHYAKGRDKSVRFLDVNSPGFSSAQNDWVLSLPLSEIQIRSVDRATQWQRKDGRPPAK